MPRDCSATKSRERVKKLSLQIYLRRHAITPPSAESSSPTRNSNSARSAIELLLIDECLTPDSSRFWPADEYVVGQSPPSFDKQFVRDYLETLDWDKTPPAPALAGRK